MIERSLVEIFGSIRIAEWNERFRASYIYIYLLGKNLERVRSIKQLKHVNYLTYSFCS